MPLRAAQVVGCVGALAGAVSLGACGKDKSPPPSPVVAAPSTSLAAARPSASAGDEPERLCSQKSICPGETVDHESEALCATLARDPICGAKFLALVKCQIAQEKCGDDGKIDQVATLELCKSEESTLHDCDAAKAAAAQASAK